MDDRNVLKHFLGKTQEQIQKQLPEKGSYYAEDFMWMRADGLRYYICPRWPPTSETSGAVAILISVATCSVP